MPHVTGHVYGQECACGIEDALSLSACQLQLSTATQTRNAARRAALAPFADDVAELTAYFQGLLIRGTANYSQLSAHLQPRIQSRYRTAQLNFIDSILANLAANTRGYLRTVSNKYIELINESGTIQGATVGEPSGDLRTVDINSVIRRYEAGTLIAQQAPYRTALTGLETSYTDTVNAITASSLVASGAIFVGGASAVAAFGGAVAAAAFVVGAVSFTPVVLAGGTYYLVTIGSQVFAASLGSLLAAAGVAGVGTIIGSAITTGGILVLAALPLAVLLVFAPNNAILRDRATGEDFITQNQLNAFISDPDVVQAYNNAISVTGSARELITELGGTIQAALNEASSGLVPQSAVDAAEAANTTYNTTRNGIYDRFCSEACTDADRTACSANDTATHEWLVRPALGGGCQCYETERDEPLCTEQERRDCSDNSTPTVTFRLTADCRCTPGVGRCTQAQVDACVPDGIWETAVVDRLQATCCRKTTIGCTPSEILAFEALSTPTLRVTAVWNPTTRTCERSDEEVELPEGCTEAQAAICTDAGQTINDDCECEGCTTAQRTACLEAGQTINDDCECEEGEAPPPPPPPPGCTDEQRDECVSLSWQTAVFDEATCDCNRTKIDCSPTDRARIQRVQDANPGVEYTPTFNRATGECRGVQRLVACGAAIRQLCLSQNGVSTTHTFTWRDHTHETSPCSCLAEEIAPPPPCPDPPCGPIVTGGFGHCVRVRSIDIDVIREQLRNGTASLLTACNGITQSTDANGFGIYGIAGRSYGLIWRNEEQRCCNVCIEEGFPRWDRVAGECAPPPPPPTDDDPPDCIAGTVRLADGSCGEPPPPPIVIPPDTPDEDPIPTEPPPSPCEELRTYSDINEPAPAPSATQPTPARRVTRCEAVPYRAPAV